MSNLEMVCILNEKEIRDAIAAYMLDTHDHDVNADEITIDNDGKGATIKWTED